MRESNLLTQGHSSPTIVLNQLINVVQRLLVLLGFSFDSL